MKNNIISLLVGLLISGVCGNTSAAITGEKIDTGIITKRKAGMSTDFASKTSNMRVPFIMNKGQENKDVSFYAKTFGGTVFVTKKGEIVYSMPLLEDQKLIKGLALKESFVGAKVRKVKGEEESITKVSYFHGKEASKWANNVQTYDSVSLGEIYDGIELKLKAAGNNVEKLFYVNEKANSDSIRMKIEGAKGMKTGENGELVIDTSLGNVRFTKPIAYQVINNEKVIVPVAYQIVDTPQTTVAYGFKVGDYDKNHTLIIDPLLASTFVGVSTYEWADALTIDASNNVYVAGHTVSADYPTTAGAFDVSCNGNWDVFISKLDSNITTLISSTFIGGAGEDRVAALSTDTSGNVYIAGHTYSYNYPTTSGTYDTSFNGGADAYISKLDSNLTTLLVSSFIGGDGYDMANSLVIDTLGNVFMAGISRSVDYPITYGAYDVSFNGNNLYYDVVVAKLNSDLSSLISSTFIGGTNNEIAPDISIDSSMQVFVSGQTSSPDYPTIPSAYDTSYNGGWDIFVSKLDYNLSSLLSSTFVGGSSDEGAGRRVLDGMGNAYITGSTNSSNYPTTIGAYDQSLNGGSDAFISKLDNNLATLLSSTFIGGRATDYATSLAIDSTGNVYVAGGTDSTTFPTSPRAYDKSFNGVRDAFISKFNGGLTSLLASTCIGGGDYESTSAIAINSSGNVYIAGVTTSFDYPTTTGALDATFNGEYDVFVSVFDSNLSR